MATIPTAQLSSSILQNPRTLKSYAFHLIPHMHYSHVMLVFSPPLHLTGLLKWRRHLILERGSAIKPPWKSIIRPMIKQSHHRPSRQLGKKLVFILWTTMKYKHQPIFQLQIPPSTPHSQTSPYFIHCLQLPLHFTLCPKPHPAQVQAPKPIRTHSMVILILLPSSHSPPMSLPELPPHQWLIQSPLLKSPCQTTHPPLLHHQRYLQGSQYPMASQLTPMLHDQSTQLWAILPFWHSHPFRQLERSSDNTLSVLTT